MPCVDYRYTAARREHGAYKNTLFKRATLSTLYSMDVHPVTMLHSQSSAVPVKIISQQV